MSDAQVAGGHKANLSNPNTSIESKQNSEKILQNEFGINVPHVKDPAHVAAGLKSAIHNPNVSEEAKEAVKERLEEM
ncbi:hypothetical protein GQ53DRAFT_849845 [Thozetella sp. PMI_491]|nr:hypothetical protein GQ53DRAFT_849845 [Thozetella sp. PMI_491]